MFSVGKRGFSKEPDPWGNEADDFSEDVDEHAPNFVAHYLDFKEEMFPGLPPLNQYEQQDYIRTSCPAMVYVADHREEQREQGCGMEIEFTKDGSILVCEAWRRYLTDDTDSPQTKANEEFWGPSEVHRKGVTPLRKVNYRHSLTEHTNKIIGWVVDRYNQYDKTEDGTTGDEGAGEDSMRTGQSDTGGNNSRRRPRIKLEDYCRIDMSDNIKSPDMNYIQGDSEMVVFAFDNGKGNKGFQILRYGYREEQGRGELCVPGNDMPGVEVSYVDVTLLGSS